MRRAFPVIFVVAFVGCGPDSEEPPPAGQSDSPEPPVVTDQRGDLLLSWFVDGGPAVATSVDGVPPGARAEVRVQDPSVAPEARDPRWVFLADLTEKEASGSYRVRVVPREQYEAGRRKVRAPAVVPSAAPARAGSGAVAKESSASGVPVIMYATRHCPVCIKARRWLLAQGIPYVERDLERDQGAAEELSRKGRAQGVSTSGVPVFDVRGRLVPGFEPGVIVKLLSAAPAPQQNI